MTKQRLLLSRRLSLSVLLLVAIGELWPLYAWEEDVHYGLTMCLAIKAGFSNSEARAIAEADQSLDDNRATKATWVVPRDIMFNLSDEDALAASLKMRAYHFPSPVGPPAQPGARMVPANSPYASELLISTDELERFGRILHAYQDSWSHAGEPDIPMRGMGPRIRPNLSWAHPEHSGGWRRHWADLTYRYTDLTYRHNDDPKYVEAMAHRTYDQLVDLRKRVSKTRTAKEVKWDRLQEESISRFAKARTKIAKIAWFKEECGLDRVDFVLKTSLRAGDAFSPDLQSMPEGRTDTAFASYVMRAANNPESKQAGRSPLRFNLISDEMPAGLWEFSEAFLETWLVRRDLESSAKAFDVDAMKRRVEGLSSATDYQELVRKQLALWLVEDHGLIEELGHGIPSEDGYQKLPSRTTDVSPEFKMVSYNSLGDALKTGAEGAALDVLKLETSSVLPVSSSSYLLVFELKHLNHDTLMLVVDWQVGWKIGGFFWFTS